ncbi:hypothetical protein B0H14DRAFT_3742119 [Mycena olivaceomarginata]|nr:hypothetical protein B0H14DRAFT_3742119 [Mycena olivaceomarginata]
MEDKGDCARWLSEWASWRRVCSRRAYRRLAAGNVRCGRRWRSDSGCNGWRRKAHRVCGCPRRLTLGARDEKRRNETESKGIMRKQRGDVKSDAKTTLRRTRTPVKDRKVDICARKVLKVLEGSEGERSAESAKMKANERKKMEGKRRGSPGGCAIPRNTWIRVGSGGVPRGRFPKPSTVSNSFPPALIPIPAHVVCASLCGRNLTAIRNPRFPLPGALLPAHRHNAPRKQDPQQRKQRAEERDRILVYRRRQHVLLRRGYRGSGSMSVPLGLCTSAVPPPGGGTTRITCTASAGGGTVESAR